jgi:hypothetical protein
VNKREKPIERLLHGIEDCIEEWRTRMSAREAELQAHRERLLAQAASEKEDRERSLEEAAKEHRVAFIVHSEEAGKALEEFVGEGARLVSLVPGDRSGQRGADIKGPWLVFE